MGRISKDNSTIGRRRDSHISQRITQLTTTGSPRMGCMVQLSLSEDLSHHASSHPLCYCHHVSPDTSVCCKTTQKSHWSNSKHYFLLSDGGWGAFYLSGGSTDSIQVCSTHLSSSGGTVFPWWWHRVWGQAETQGLLRPQPITGALDTSTHLLCVEVSHRAKLKVNGEGKDTLLPWWAAEGVLVGQ